MRIAAPILFLNLFRISWAIYADEAYQLDHHLALLGRPQQQSTFFHRPSTSTTASLLYALSEDGVLGAVNPKDGSLLWRRNIGADRRDHQGQGFLKVASDTNFIASVLENKLQVYDAIDGRLLWTWLARGNIKSLEILPDLQEPAIAVLEHYEGSDTIKLLASESGEEKWQFQGSSGDTGHSLSHRGSVLFYTALHPSLLKGFKIKVAQLDVSTGREATAARVFNVDGDVSSIDSIIYTGRIAKWPVVVWTDKGLKIVKLLSLSHMQINQLPLDLEEDFNAKTVTIIATEKEQSDPDFVLHLQADGIYTGRVFSLDGSSGKLADKHRLPTFGGRGAFSVGSNGEAVHFLHHSLEKVELISSKTAAVLQRWSLRSENIGIVGSENSVDFAVAEIAQRSDGKFSVRYAQLLESGEWEMIVNGESSWLRSEGITGVVGAAFADIAGDGTLAAKLAIEGRSNVLYACYHRLKRQLNDINSLPAWLSTNWDKMTGLTWRTAHTDLVRADRFGLHKLVIILTKRGYVSAVDTGNRGRIIWIARLEPFLDHRFKEATIWISNASAIIQIGGASSFRIDLASGTSLAVDIDDTNSPLHADTSPADLTKADSEALHSALQDLTLNSDSAHHLLIARSKDGRRLTAWLPSLTSKSNLAWEFTAAAGELVVDTVHRPTHDAVASIGRVLGDRSVLYKHINCNILLVICQASTANRISFSVLDAASGNILYFTSHSDIDLKQPITASVSENTFAWSIFSNAGHDQRSADAQSAAGFQLTTGEIYESALPNDRGKFAATPLSAQEASNFSDRYSSTLPHVILHTLLISEPLSSLAFTTTRQGITPRSLLAVTAHSKAVVSIPRHFLDPRRPTGRDPTAAEVEEGLFRSNGLLDFDSKWSLNHEQECLGFSRIVTSPSLLESTGLVFAFGKFDLLTTRTSPIGGFDVLGKGFSKLQLAATVIALAIATTILGPMVRRKQVDGAWKL